MNLLLDVDDIDRLWAAQGELPVALCASAGWQFWSSAGPGQQHVPWRCWLGDSVSTLIESQA